MLLAKTAARGAAVFIAHRPPIIAPARPIRKFRSGAVQRHSHAGRFTGHEPRLANRVLVAARVFPYGLVTDCRSRRCPDVSWNMIDAFREEALRWRRDDPTCVLRTLPRNATSRTRDVLAGAADGDRLLAQRGLSGLRDTLSTVRSETGWSHFWRGYVLQFDDLGLARAEWLARRSVLRARERLRRVSS